jgi:purine nucleosidase
MRRFLIDTDTGSDDAVALVMALREPSVRVEAITVVAGNVPLPTALRNAAASVEAAGTYAPPLYAGAAKPLLREGCPSEYVHGPGGMSGMEIAEPRSPLAPGHAALAIIELARRYAGELELLTLGPLTNLALALALDPGIGRLIRSATLMAGAGLGPSNVSAVAEFNVHADAEAASMVLSSDLKPAIVGWDACLGAALLGPSEWEEPLLAAGTGPALFCERCTRSVRVFYPKHFGTGGFGLADPAAATAALRPDLVAESIDARVSVETASQATYGQLVIDRRPGVEPNARVVLRLKAGGYKEYMLSLVAG